jgi:hypothetical protein
MNYCQISHNCTLQHKDACHAQKRKNSLHVDGSNAAAAGNFGDEAERANIRVQFHLNRFRSKVHISNIKNILVIFSVFVPEQN